MKRIYKLFLTIIMLLMLTACGGVEKSISTSESSEVSINTTESTNEFTDSTEDGTQGTIEDNTEEDTQAASKDNTEGTTSIDGTDSTTSESTEATSTETCDHAYDTTGMTDCKGILTYVCRKCQHSYEVETGKIDHKWELCYTKQPTLTKEGTLDKECTECHLIETEVVGKLLLTQNVYINRLHCFLESDSPLNTELFTLEDKTKVILYNIYPDEITEEELFTKWRCFEFGISNDEIEEMKNTSFYNSAKKVFLSYDAGTHLPIYTCYLGYTDNQDGTITAYASIEEWVADGVSGNYVEIGFCKIEMKYAEPSTNEQMATFYVTSIMRVESVPTNLIK